VARAAALILAAAMACASKKGSEPAEASPRVVVETAAGARHAVTVELARTDEERARGLMHRRSLPDDRGMLFLFGETAEHAFWMKNTPLPLDIVFIDDGGRIVGVVERAEPYSEALRTVGAPSRYVLEVNGGWTRARGVGPGDRVRFENVPRY
jgi:uncharacterized membrane protein (UPF0127 family)